MSAVISVTCVECQQVSKVPKGVYTMQCAHCSTINKVQIITTPLEGLEALSETHGLQVKQSFEVCYTEPMNLTRGRTLPCIQATFPFNRATVLFSKLVPSVLVTLSMTGSRGCPSSYIHRLREQQQIQGGFISQYHVTYLPRYLTQCVF